MPNACYVPVYSTKVAYSKEKPKLVWENEFFFFHGVYLEKL